MWIRRDVPGPVTPPLRVLLVSHYFRPEPFRINQVVADLVAAGAEVTVLTGQPNYPGGRIFAGYRAWAAGIEQVDEGFTVVRVPIVPRGNGGGIRLVLNYLSFIVTGILIGAWLLRRRRFDVVFVYCTTPAIQGYVGVWFGLLKRARVVQWVQDLWPEVLSATGFIHTGWILRPIRWIIGVMYRRSDLVLGQSHAFVRFLTPQAGRTPVAYFPNPGEHLPDAVDGGIDLGPGFHVMFGGNMGKAQAMETTIAVAELLRDDPEIRFTLFGAGAMVPWIEQAIVDRRLDNVRLGGSMPPEAMPALYAQAGALLLTLVDDPLVAQTVPSKLQSYLAAGRPIVVAVNGEAADIVREAGAGIACPAEDPIALAAAIRTLKALSPAERAAMGASGCRFFADHYKPDRLVRQLLGLLRDAPSAADVRE
jgi:glycosyltransferase involved in cell wall biosynthesis